MNIKAKKFLQASFLTLIFIMTFFISGCWNYREIDQMGIASGIAIDKAGKNFLVTCEVIEMAGQKGLKYKTFTLSMKGDTVFDAKRKLIEVSGKKVYLGHAQIAVISNKIAKKSIIPVLDYFTRDAETRYTFELIISKEKTARQILKKKVKQVNINSFEIKNMLNNQKALSQAPNIALWQFETAMPSYGQSAVLPLVSQIKNNGQTIPEVAGTAVFKKDKLVGYLNSHDTKSFLFIRNQIRGGLLTIKQKLGKDYSNIALEIFSNKTKIKPEIINGKLTMKISTKTVAALGENSGTANFVSKKGVNKLENDFARQLENNIKNLVKKVQTNYDSDIFGFGNKTKINMPDLWRSIEPKWDKEFKKVKVNVDSTIIIRNSGLESKSLKAGD